jgi:hypothetical protein
MNLINYGILIMFQSMKLILTHYNKGGGGGQNIKIHFEFCDLPICLCIS